MSPFWRQTRDTDASVAISLCLDWAFQDSWGLPVQSSEDAQTNSKVVRDLTPRKTKSVS